jgi:hypothetical protein
MTAKETMDRVIRKIETAIEELKHIDVDWISDRHERRLKEIEGELQAAVDEIQGIAATPCYGSDAAEKG